MVKKIRCRFAARNFSGYKKNRRSDAVALLRLSAIVPGIVLLGTHFRNPLGAFQLLPN